ncbi:MAG: glycosyltransferase family 9 protein [Bacteriovoracaceae bacterium]|nr:glycosyltransferase family 9 protein [Bacteriovoracaceae bacterium]
MKKILIINLRKLGDVFSTAHLINSLSKEGNTHISLLTYKESARAAHCIKNVNEVFEIDRKEIITLKTNKLFSDSFALEQLFKQLEKITNESWDQIINYSNDTVGAYVTSYLRKDSSMITGVHFNDQRNIVTQNDWELVFNDVLPQVRYSPIHFVDCYHKMSGAAPHREGFKVITNPRHNETAFLNFQELRRGHGGNENQTKIIGIQLKTADQTKDIPLDTLHKLYELIKKNSEIIPCLLIAPNDEERQIATEFNSHHNDEVIIVEADLNAIASVLLNLDLLVSPDTSIKHIANLTETPVLEISLGYAPFLKQGSYAKDTLVLTDSIINRSFKKNSFSRPTLITANDIMATILYSLSITKTVKPRLSEGVTLYQAQLDELGITYNPIAGSIDTSVELQRMASRQLLHQMLDSSSESFTNIDLNKINKNEAQEWINKEKSDVTFVMRDLLGTLRSLLQCAESKKSTREFIASLDKILSNIDKQTLVQIPSILFKTKIEAINAKTFDENTKEIESLLYKLKSDMQKLLQCLIAIESQLSASKVEDMVSRTHESIRN